MAPFRDYTTTFLKIVSGWRENFGFKILFARVSVCFSPSISTSRGESGPVFCPHGVGLGPQQIVLVPSRWGGGCVCVRARTSRRPVATDHRAATRLRPLPPRVAYMLDPDCGRISFRAEDD
jgi:hypothetical protein